MTSDGQIITKQTYEDPELVNQYLQRNGSSKVDDDSLDYFIQALNGKKVLDLGCGPGHHSCRMAEKGLEVIAFDYSREMIHKAEETCQFKEALTFKIGDMRQLEKYFEPSYFDGIWANASLLHIRKENIDAVLHGIQTISKPGAVVYISLKGGEGTVIETTDKYGKPTTREFTLWDKKSFVDVAAKNGLLFKDLLLREGYTFLGKPTTWLRFVFAVRK